MNLALILADRSLFALDRCAQPGDRRAPAAAVREPTSATETNSWKCTKAHNLSGKHRKSSPLNIHLWTPPTRRMS